VGSRFSRRFALSGRPTTEEKHCAKERNNCLTRGLGLDRCLRPGIQQRQLSCEHSIGRQRTELPKWSQKHSKEPLAAKVFARLPGTLSCPAFVAVMQSADLRKLHHLSELRRLHPPCTALSTATATLFPLKKQTGGRNSLKKSSDCFPTAGA
jgi:hypothetical protein